MREAIDNSPMGFADACTEAATIPEFVEQYNRLTGNNFRPPRTRTPIEMMIDEACGYPLIDEDETRKFAAFFYEFVWSRLPEEAFVTPKGGTT